MLKQSKLVENTTAADVTVPVAAGPGDNKENMIVPSQTIQNSNQSSAMHSNVMKFTNAAGSSPTYAFNLTVKCKL